MIKRSGVLFVVVPGLAIAIFIFGFEIQSISRVNGWWLDELFTLWSTDPSNPFFSAFAERFKDTTPPLYYAALFWTRYLVADQRLAVVLLNLAALSTAFLVILTVSRKSQTVGWAICAAAAFLCSGPVLRYTIEGRAYLLALTVTFAASWICMLAIDVRDERPNLLTFALTGVVAALTHIFAALFCCSLSTGMIVMSFFGRRRDMLRPALAIGAPAGILTVGFLVWIFDLAPTWITFTYLGVIKEGEEVGQLTFGSWSAAEAFLLLLAIGLIMRPTRLLAAIFGLAWALFVLIPLLVSFKQPIIMARYWMLGAPSPIVFAIFLTRVCFKPRYRTDRFYSHLSISFAPLVLLVVMNGGGYFYARKLTSEKSIWRGTATVVPLIKNCPVGSVHVYPGVMNEFSAATQAPASVFVDAESPKTKPLRIADSKCPVLGWAEHIFHGANSSPPGNFVFNASSDELLHILKIDAPPSEVNIIRHWSGYVVIRQ